MINQALRLLTISTLLFMALIATLVISAGVHSQLGNQQVKDVDDRSDNARQKSLRELAQERDVEIEYSSESDAEYQELKPLIRSSNLIVYGRIADQVSSFTKSGSFIETSYFVDAHRVIKSDFPLALPIKFVRVGGVVQVNGNRASVKVKGNDRLKVDRDYILFLEWSLNRQGYILAGGMSGAFLVTDNSQVKPLASSQRSNISLNYRDTPVESFINEVLASQ
jgi:hypothetical protein